MKNFLAACAAVNALYVEDKGLVIFLAACAAVNVNPFKQGQFKGFLSRLCGGEHVKGS